MTAAFIISSSVVLIFICVQSEMVGFLISYFSSVCYYNWIVNINYTSKMLFYFQIPYLLILIGKLLNQPISWLEVSGSSYLSIGDWFNVCCWKIWIWIGELRSRPSMVKGPCLIKDPLIKLYLKDSMSSPTEISNLNKTKSLLDAIRLCHNWIAIRLKLLDTK